jgi:hypothetical protein
MKVKLFYPTTRHSAILPLLLLFACNGEGPPPPDVSDIRVDLTVLRFEKELLAIDTTDLAAEIDRLDRTYGNFTDVFLTHLVPVRRGDFSPEEGREVLKAYLGYPLTQYVDSLVDAEFETASAGGGAPGVSQVQGLAENLEQGLKYYRHYLPEAPIPDTLVTFASHFDLAAFIYGDGQLAAGLDFFLGRDFPYGQVDPNEPIFSDYLIHTYTPDHFTGKLLRVLIEDRFPPPRSGRLIDYLIYEGKKLYLLELLQPETERHLVYEVTPEEMDWLEENETAIYTYLQQERELYATEVDKIQKYTRPAPYSPGMPPESPGGAVNYLGRQIVASYLSVNPDVSIAELMRMEDGQDILQGARYKPR